MRCINVAHITSKLAAILIVCLTGCGTRLELQVVDGDTGEPIEASVHQRLANGFFPIIPFYRGYTTSNDGRSMLSISDDDLIDIHCAHFAETSGPMGWIRVKHVKGGKWSYAYDAQLIQGDMNSAPFQTVRLVMPRYRSFLETADEQRVLGLTRPDLLTSASLYRGAVTIASLEHLEKADNLHALILSEWNDPMPLSSVGKMRGLEYLQIAYGTLDQRRLEPLSGAKSLEQLEIKFVPLTSEDAEYLIAIPNLKKLWLRYTRISPAATAAIRQRRPDIEVEVSEDSALPPPN